MSTAGGSWASRVPWQATSESRRKEQRRESSRKERGEV
jgi:hypothetical protein